jgi:hypothetical protein
MAKSMGRLDAVADELVGRLDLMGLPARKGPLEDEEGGQCRALAKWKVAPGSAVHIYMYAAPYFGSHPLWFGFGARSATGVDLITRGFDPAAFSKVAYSDWNNGYDLVDVRKMKEVRRNEYTVREDYRRQGLWIWFGRYFEFGPRVAEEAMGFLSTVIDMHRPPPQSDDWDGPTDGVATTKVRLQQKRFRDAVLARWSRKCALTGCGIIRLLEAAHIEPYSKNVTSVTRTSPENGLPLLSTLHRLFDRGLITFSDAGRLRVNRLLGSDERKRLNVRNGMKLSKPLSTKQKQYMQLHRKRWGFDRATT